MFTFDCNKLSATAKKTNKIELISATEELICSYMEMNETMRNIEEVSQVMENIQQSLNAIAQFGKDAVPILNIDKGLEGLLGIKERLITAEKAQEGLGDALKNAWEKLKGWVHKAILWFLSFFSAKAKEKYEMHQAVDELASALDIDASSANNMKSFLSDMLDTDLSELGKITLENLGLVSLEGSAAPYYEPEKGLVKLSVLKTMVDGINSPDFMKEFNVTQFVRTKILPVDGNDAALDELIDDINEKMDYLNNPDAGDRHHFSSVLRTGGILEQHTKPYDAGYRSFEDCKTLLRISTDAERKLEAHAKYHTEQLNAAKAGLSSIGTLTPKSNNTLTAVSKAYKLALAYHRIEAVECRVMYKVLIHTDRVLTKILKKASASA